MYKAVFVAVLIPASGVAAAQQALPHPGDPKAKVPAVEYRSAFEGYQPFADQEAAAWRRANEEVGAAGGHFGRRPGRGAGAQTSKPQPGPPQSSGHPAEQDGHRGDRR